MEKIAAAVVPVAARAAARRITVVATQTRWHQRPRNWATRSHLDLTLTHIVKLIISPIMVTRSNRYGAVHVAEVVGSAVFA